MIKHTHTQKTKEKRSIYPSTSLQSKLNLVGPHALVAYGPAKLSIACIGFIFIMYLRSKLDFGVNLLHN